MITITQVISDILQSDEVALEAMREGLLNFSAYAKKIKAEVEKASFKEVQKGTIVVALSRFAKDSRKLTVFPKPKVVLTNLSVKSPFTVLSFEKTQNLELRVPTLSPFLVSSADIFSLTQGSTEVTIVCTEKSRSVIINHFDVKPKKEFSNCTAITVQMDAILAETPNVLWVLFTSLTRKQINIIEVVSTYTELTFIVEKNQLEKTIEALNVYGK